MIVPGSLFLGRRGGLDGFVVLVVGLERCVGTGDEGFTVHLVRWQHPSGRARAMRFVQVDPASLLTNFVQVG